MAPKSVPVPMITRVRLRNFRSIAECDVELGPLTILVGPNGSGKSNFLRALDFVSDSLNNGLEAAVGRAGGMTSLLSRWALDDPPAQLRIELEIDLPNQRQGTYEVALRHPPTGGYLVAEERCEVVVSQSPLKTESFRIDETSGRWINTRGHVSDPRRGLTKRTLTLPHHADHVHFGAVYRAVAGISTYSFHVSEMRTLRASDGGERLASDGTNVASVLARMTTQNEEGWSPAERVADFMSAISSRVDRTYVVPIDRYLALRFDERVEEPPGGLLSFDASEVSYGTLRTFGVLVALYQGSMAGGSPVTLVGLEEPETAVHPGAATALFEAMDEASLTTQVLVTTHSPSMLEDEGLDIDTVRAVAIDQDRTRIGRINSGSRRLLEEHLYSAGELLRMRRLAPEVSLEDPPRGTVATSRK